MTHPSYNGQDLRARAAKLQREYALRFLCGPRPNCVAASVAIAEVSIEYFRHLDGQEDALISTSGTMPVWTLNVCAAANCCRSENGRTA